MTCVACQSLTPSFRIAVPDDLRRALTMPSDAVSVRLLEVEPARLTGHLHKLAASPPWEDVVLFHLACTHCGQAFELSAETYHGSGGASSVMEPPPT